MKKKCILLFSFILFSIPAMMAGCSCSAPVNEPNPALTFALPTAEPTPEDSFVIPQITPRPLSVSVSEAKPVGLVLVEGSGSGPYEMRIAGGRSQEDWHNWIEFEFGSPAMYYYDYLLAKGGEALTVNGIADNPLIHDGNQMRLVSAGGSATAATVQGEPSMVYDGSGTKLVASISPANALEQGGYIAISGDWTLQPSLVTRVGAAVAADLTGDNQEEHIFVQKKNDTVSVTLEQANRSVVLLDGLFIVPDREVFCRF